jgi:uncharacterized protein
MRVSTREAEIVAAECARVWLEASRCSVLSIRSMPEGVGAGRPMVGSDALESVPLELANYRPLALEEPALERCLGGTPDEVFRV